MKALSMLDHVMLWVARGFAVYVLAGMLYCVGDLCSSYYWASGHMSQAHHAWNWQRVIIQNREAEFYLLFLSLVAGLWNLSLWWLRKDACRLYLFLSSSLVCAAFTYQFFDLLVMHTNLPTGQDWLSATVMPLGFFAMAWAGFRATGNPPLKWLPTLTRHRAIPPQPAATNHFRAYLNPVNLVIP
jgi:hypothetical protein